MDNLLLADDLELFAMQDDLQSLGVSPSLIMAAATIRSQAREIMVLKEELETARGASSMKKPSDPFNGICERDPKRCAGQADDA